MIIGIIGYGYWGPNIVRNFHDHLDCHVKYICDYDLQARKRAKVQYPDIDIVDSIDILLNDQSIDIIAIVTPVSTHYKLAKKALEHGKHIFVEKPMVETVTQAEKLIKIAKRNNLIGVVDHTFLFTGAVQKIKQIVDSGEIGEITYFDSVRVNLGLFQHDVDVIWDLAPHDLSILFYLVKEYPSFVTAHGVDHLNNGLVDIAYLNLMYKTKMIANFHVNWLSPVKVRKILIGGTKKMIVYNDMEPSEKIKIYNKGIIVNEPEKIHKLLVKYRSGDMLAPNISPTEALKLEVDNFIQQIKDHSPNSINDLSHGLDIVKVLESSKLSLTNKKTICINEE